MIKRKIINYINCHKKCRIECEIEKCIISKENSEIESQIKFSCDCGIILKHCPNPIKKIEIMPCPMLQIDKNFFPDQMFFCHEDNCYLCSICYFNCHKNCKNKSIIKEKKKLL